MKTIFLKVLFLTAFLCIFSGCGSRIADEKRILSDLETGEQFQFLGADEEIGGIVIEKRQTDKKQRTDTVWCTVTVKDSQVAYEKEVVLIYGLYDKEGWVLDNVSVNHESQWMQTPLAGIDEGSILASLAQYYVIADNERWDIEANQVETFSVEKHETNLEEKTDFVTVSLTLDGEVEKAVGQLVICYQFDNGWKIASLSGDEEFTTAVKTETALSVDSEDLIDVIVNEQAFCYGGTAYETGSIIYANTAGQQSITLDKALISDFVIESTTSSQKGCCQDYDCSFTLAKPHVTFQIAVRVQYYYSDSEGWKAYLTELVPQVADVDIDGEWKGTYMAAGDTGDVTLSIQTDDNGLVTAVYSYFPSGTASTTKYDQPGSYYATGEFDPLTLSFGFTAGDWIEEPGSTFSWTKSDIAGTLQVEEAEITGKGHNGYLFQVAQ